MMKRTLLNNLTKYRKNPRKRQAYLRAFEKLMVYRTTKTEHPETTHKMVEDALQKF